MRASTARSIAVGCAIFILTAIGGTSHARLVCQTAIGSCSAGGGPGGVCTCTLDGKRVTGRIVGAPEHPGLDELHEHGSAASGRAGGYWGWRPGSGPPSVAVDRGPNLGRPNVGAPEIPAIIPPNNNQVLTTRNFFGPHDVPPINFAAYGIVAFPQTATSSTLQRYKSICEAYVATLPLVSATSAPTTEQMVTVWPVESASLASRLNGQGEAVCKEAVEHYDLPTALIALKEARTQERKELSGVGPYLLAWTPSSKKGQPDTVVLVLDLSDATVDQHYLSYFQDWREKIEQNPKLWRNGTWSMTEIRVLADKYGNLLFSGHTEKE